MLTGYRPIMPPLLPLAPQAPVPVDRTLAKVASASHFVFLLVPNFSMIAFVNALEVLRIANQLSGKPLYRWSVISVDGRPVPASNGLTLSVDVPEAPGPADIVFVCAGNEVQHATTPAHLQRVRQFAHAGALLGSICTGAYVLAKAGLLAGHTCVIHWEYLHAQAESFIDVTFERSIFRIDRDRITCAGGVAPLEMMLYLVGLSMGDAFMQRISSYLAVDRVRHPGALQPPAGYGSTSRLLAEVLQLMEAHIETPLSLVALAQRAGVRERRLLRLFRSAVGQPVMQHYRLLRLRRARQLLQQSAMLLTDIAVACGFQSLSVFTSAYRKTFGLTPGQERRQAQSRTFGGDAREHAAERHDTVVAMRR
ncbi:GlxA family transcriptional regulator [Burkholderia cenocepacia]|uniref:GlxA family transcriptional regulator n=1 Tax=Burkholderia cenocepacia TaxID=95486 RepID=UPI001B9346A6|nr:GlxA family transcriptional regulator [Burkholderia cenocepacia]MBR8209307.1 GlxA family transcriptional regulator [Burkholderia cenocepacia]